VEGKEGNRGGGGFPVVWGWCRVSGEGEQKQKSPQNPGGGEPKREPQEWLKRWGVGHGGSALCHKSDVASPIEKSIGAPKKALGEGKFAAAERTFTKGRHLSRRGLDSIRV